MSIADILINLIIFLLQKIVLPVLPTNLPLFSYADLNTLLTGSLEHNVIYSFAGLNNLMNLNLLFILLLSIIGAEFIFWLVKAGFFVIRLVRG